MNNQYVGTHGDECSPCTHVLTVRAPFNHLDRMGDDNSRK